MVADLLFIWKLARIANTSSQLLSLTIDADDGLPGFPASCVNLFPEIRLAELAIVDQYTKISYIPSCYQGENAEICNNSRCSMRCLDNHHCINEEHGHLWI
jgi:hypothetical protein